MLGNTRTWSLHSHQRGQNLIEVGILIPLLIFLLVGVFDIARSLNNFIIITNASREGARYASRFPADTNGAKQAAIDEAANSGVTIAAPDVTVTCSPCTSGNKIQVHVAYQMTTFVGSFMGISTLPMTRRTEMVIFGLPPPP